jgi:VanZ family protein
MDPIHQKGTQDDKVFYEYIEKLTDRELQEKQAYYLRNNEKLNIKILSNLQFWFYFTISCLVIGVIAFLNSSK